MNTRTFKLEKKGDYTLSIVGEFKNLRKYFHAIIKCKNILLDKKTFTNIFDAEIQVVNWEMDYKIGNQYLEVKKIAPVVRKNAKKNK